MRRATLALVAALALATIGYQPKARSWPLRDLLVLGNGTGILPDQPTGNEWVLYADWFNWTSVHIAHGSGWGGNYYDEPLQISQWVLAPASGTWYWLTTTAGNANWVSYYDHSQLEWDVVDPEGNVWYTKCHETTPQFTAIFHSMTCTAFLNGTGHAGTMVR